VGGRVKKLRALRGSTRLLAQGSLKRKGLLENSMRAFDSQDSVEREMVRISLEVALELNHTDGALS
jgi:hypothetical protein